MGGADICRPSSSVDDCTRVAGGNAMLPSLKKRGGAESSSSKGLSGSIATEQDPDGCLLNISYVNIDWKRSRHASAKAERRNLPKLDKTIKGILRLQKPAVLCICEFGEVLHPLAPQHVDVVKHLITKAWASVHGFATEPIVDFSLNRT